MYSLSLLLYIPFTDSSQSPTSIMKLHSVWIKHMTSSSSISPPLSYLCHLLWSLWSFSVWNICSFCPLYIRHHGTSFSPHPWNSPKLLLEKYFLVFIYFYYFLRFRSSFFSFTTAHIVCNISQWLSGISGWEIGLLKCCISNIFTFILDLEFDWR